MARGGEAEVGDGRATALAGRPVVQRDVDGGADGEGVVAGDALARAATRRRRRHVAVDAQLEELAAQAGEQRGGAVQGDDAALVHDGDAVAELLGLVEVVGGEQDRHARPGPQAGDEVEQLVADARVEADGGLVEEQHLRVGDQRPGDLEPAALAAAVGVDGPVDELAEAERRRRRRRCAARAAAGSSPHSRACTSRLRRPVRGRSTTGSWNTTALARRAAIGCVATSKPATRARPDGGGDGGGEHADGGRLAGPVRAEQTEHLAGRHVEVDALHGLDAARVGLGQASIWIVDGERVVATVGIDD